MSAYFDSYECFDDEKKANDIVADALKKLKAEMTDKAKALVQEYRMAEAEKARLTREIGKLKEQATDLKAYYEQLSCTDLPREFMRNMVKSAGGEYAPGDKAWIIDYSFSQQRCQFCNGDGVTTITYCDNGKKDKIKCPHCGGKGVLNRTDRHSKEVRITDVDLKLCFDRDRVQYWNTECIRVTGCDGVLHVKDVYKTKEDADKAIKALEEKENCYEVD